MPPADHPAPCDAPLILASRSEARAGLLRRARVAFELRPAAVDEAEIKRSLAAEEVPPRDVADVLAEAKAARVSRKAPGRVVLGADQVLALGGRILDKPRDLAEAREHLLLLRGRRHQLLSAAVLFDDGRPVWRHVGVARLAMRDFSDAFLADYLAGHGPRLLETVGAYRLEDGGAALFDRIEGDHFSVLGLPLLELLAQLRRMGLCPA